jgi:hypothetical protein
VIENLTWKANQCPCGKFPNEYGPIFNKLETFDYGYYKKPLLQFQVEKKKSL